MPRIKTGSFPFHLLGRFGLMSSSPLSWECNPLEPQLFAGMCLFRLSTSGRLWTQFEFSNTTQGSKSHSSFSSGLANALLVKACLLGFYFPLVHSFLFSWQLIKAFNKTLSIIYSLFSVRAKQGTSYLVYCSKWKLQELFFPSAKWILQGEDKPFFSLSGTFWCTRTQQDGSPFLHSSN